MVSDFLGATFMAHGFADPEAAGALAQALLVIGALAVIARINLRARSRRA